MARKKLLKKFSTNYLRKLLKNTEKNATKNCLKIFLKKAQPKIKHFKMCYSFKSTFCSVLILISNF